jgi:hypothetical protein
MALSSAGGDSRTHVMEMRRNEPGYTLSTRRALFSHKGTELLIRPLLSGLHQLSSEKIQSYLASELRDRIRTAEVRIRCSTGAPGRTSRCSRASSAAGCCTRSDR